jgi:DNA-binding PadR family transcriptional regulator
MDFSGDLVKGSVIPAILALVNERPMYGYEMVKLVDARTGGKLQWRQGTLYPALHKLESDGLITSQWKPAGGKPAAGKPAGAKSAGGERTRKYYSITRSGRRELAKRSAEWNDFSTSLNRLLAGGGEA